MHSWLWTYMLVSIEALAGPHHGTAEYPIGKRWPSFTSRRPTCGILPSVRRGWSSVMIQRTFGGTDARLRTA